MRLLVALVLLGTLTCASVFAGGDLDRHLVLEHARPADVAQALSREFGGLKSPVQIKTGERAGELVIAADRALAAVIEQRARQLDLGPSHTSGAVMMEVAVVEEEADGSRHVVASPRVVSMMGQQAVVKVKSDERGLDLQVKPTCLANGRIQLGVDCKSWRMLAGAGGALKLHSREVHSRVVVANGNRITLRNSGDERLSLELEVHAL